MSRVWLREERGVSAVGMAIAVLLAGGLLAVPLVMMARSQRDATERGLGAVERAEGLAGRATLSLATRAAGTYFAERGSYAAFSPQAASLVEPAVRWNASSTAIPGQVSIRAVGLESLVLVTADGAGNAACAAMRGATPSFGSQDAATPNACPPSS